MTDTLFIASLAISILSALAAVGFALNSGVRGSRLWRRRLDGVRLRGGVAQRAKDASGGSVKREEKSGIAMLDALAKKILPRQQLLRERIARTGRDIPLGSYLGVNVVLVLIVMGAVHLILGFSSMTALAVAIVVGVGGPHYVIGVLAARRSSQFNEVFPDAIDLIVRGLRSGLPVGESISSVGREMPGPVGVEFRKVTDAVKFGQPLDEALWDVTARLGTPEFKFFVISLSVQKDTGGNLAETLANLSDILRKRRQMRLKIKAMSSEAKASAMILGGLPFIMFALIYMLAPEYETQLFTDPRGKMMLGAGLGIMTVGILIMRKMVRFEI